MLTEKYEQIRGFSERLAEPLTPEDCGLQSMSDASPTKWHLAHTTWFFETFLLSESPGYRPFNQQFDYLFNSYYNSIGDQFPRPKRGQISRPSLSEVRDYRQHVDRGMLELLGGDDAGDKVKALVELGLQHEQQHQELILTDIKHALWGNPLLPVYQDGHFDPGIPPERTGWQGFDEGLCQVGYAGDGFHFDNESPSHRVFLESFEISNQLVTCGDYLRFIQDGGYERPEFWLSLGWQTVRERGWGAPLYWYRRDEQQYEFTLAGPRKLDPASPVSHISYFEADAYARWAGARLPTEAEWEHAAGDVQPGGNFVDALMKSGAVIHPRCGSDPAFYGDAWEWTSSPYQPYPGYSPPVGALGEYNGKFMCNQYVLRGGSCATSATHIRKTYRNFFAPHTRWQFSAIRLCR